MASQHGSYNPFLSLITSGCHGSSKDFKGMTLDLHEAVSLDLPSQFLSPWWSIRLQKGTH